MEETTDLKATYDAIEKQGFDNLAALYAMANERSEDDPLELQEKMTLYGNIMEIMGDLEAAAVGMEKLAYAYRQEKKADAFLRNKKSEKGGKLSSDERKAIAELAVKGLRRQEAHFAEASKKWRNRKDSVLEQINIMKRKQDLHGDNWNKANYINGYS